MMYHVSKDKRAVKSAQLIWEGLEKCLREKELGKIRVADISEKSYVSRATFYRLFDSIEDVLVYECDLIFKEITSGLENGSFASSKDLILFFIKQWLDQKMLMRVLLENHLTNILYETHMKNKELIRAVYIRASDLSDEEADYLLSILSGMIPSVLHVWYSHGQTESAEQILDRVCRSISLIDITLNE